MSTVFQTVRLTSEAKYGRKVPPAAVGQVLRVLPLAVKRSIRMGFSGRSTSKGQPPGWLKAASEIRYTGLEADRGDTLLQFEAPAFGDAAPELYEQGDLWPTRPPAEDTGFDLLGDVLADVQAQSRDSDRFDRALLECLARFRGGFAEGFTGLYMSGHRYTSDNPAALTPATLQSAGRLRDDTPLPQRVRVVGQLDMLWKSRQRFRLTLDDGEEAEGVLLDGDLAALASLFNRRVVVHARAVYRPSGRLLRLDAAMVEDGTNEPALWSRIPPARTRRLNVEQFRQPQGPRTGVAAIIGRWPGDETDEEIQKALEELS